jgi:5-oxoprolinase (ATP-hydrolysing) subunit A
MEQVARSTGHPFTAEAFADRRYQADGTLLPRSEPGAVLTDPEEVARQVRGLVTHGEVFASDGGRVAVSFGTLCVHGDTPGAATLALRVRLELEALGVSVSTPR